MNVPLAIPLATITCCHSGCGVEVRVVGLGADRGRVDRAPRRRPASTRARARGTTGPSRWAARAARSPRASSSSGQRERVALGGPRPEVAVLVVAGGHRDVQLARPGDQVAVRRRRGSRCCSRARRDRRVPRPARTATRARGRASLGGAAAGRMRTSAALELLGPSAGGLGPVRGDREVSRQRQLLQADDARALAGGHPDPDGERRLVLVGIGVPALLDQPEPQRLACRRACACRRRRWREGGAQLGHRTGTCWVMQCGPPPPYARTAPGTDTISRPG